MPRFAANLSWLFQEIEPAERCAAARAAGFEAIEILFPYDRPAAAFAADLAAQGLQAVLINAPPGDWAAGDRGLAALPGREADFMAALERALAYADAIGCPRIHIMAGLSDGSARAEAVYRANLARAADRAAVAGLALTIEPINRRDMPHYHLHRSDHAADILAALDRPNLGLQFDLYHAQISEGDLTTRLVRLLPLITHIQIAGCPGRNEPDIGEIHYPYLFALLDRLAYAGWVGCEYRPASTTLDGLGWRTAPL